MIVSYSKYIFWFLGVVLKTQKGKKDFLGSEYALKQKYQKTKLMFYQQSAGALLY